MCLSGLKEKLSQPDEKKETISELIKKVQNAQKDSTQAERPSP